MPRRRAKKSSAGASSSTSAEQSDELQPVLDRIPAHHHDFVRQWFKADTEESLQRCLNQHLMRCRRNFEVLDIISNSCICGNARLSFFPNFGPLFSRYLGKFVGSVDMDFAVFRSLRSGVNQQIYEVLAADKSLPLVGRMTFLIVFAVVQCQSVSL